MPFKPSLTPVAEDDINMLEVSDKMAAKWNVSRREADEFALRSQLRAKAAMDKGYFKDEIIPVTIQSKKGSFIFDTDEHPRPETTLESLSALPSVRPGGVTTAGNASGRNDGAAFVLMMTEEKAKELGYTPYAAWIIGAEYGVCPQ